MPIYDIECDDCGIFEVIIPLNEKAVCPKCGKDAKKLVSAVSFEFKCAMPTWSGGKSGIKNNQWNDKPKLKKRGE